MVIQPSYEKFSEWIGDVLKYLYDSAYLQTHPLAEVLVDKTADGRHRSQMLRKKILDAIRTMYPHSQVSTQSPDWRSYKILELRYIQGLNWAEVMQKLGLGKTLYYRSHALALEAITQALWEEVQQKTETPPPLAESTILMRTEEAQVDLQRLVRQATWEVIDPWPIVEELRPVIIPLAQAKSVSLSFNLEHKFKVLQADRVMLRQTILNVFTYALDISDGGRLAIVTVAEGHEARLCVQVEKGDGKLFLTPSRPRQGLGLDICGQLMREMGGLLYLKSNGEDYWQARLAWPTSVNLRLLVVDDNEGLVDLFRRYLTGSDWDITGVTISLEAHQIITETRPGVIILDVMMPGEDGWELLMKLKAGQDTKDIPVVICSVLNEPQLAQNLGAAAYLPKPVTQEALLQTLKPWRRVGATLGPVL